MAGFTVVEILVTLGVLSVLLASGWTIGSSYFAYQMGGRDGERQSDVEGLARQFEQYYRVNASLSGPSYPTTTQVTSSLSSVIGTTNLDITMAPGNTSSSVVAAGSTSAQSPTIDQYIYQPFNASGGLCSSAPCVRFIFYYQLEKTSTVVTVNSVRQQ